MREETLKNNAKVIAPFSAGIKNIMSCHEQETESRKLTIPKKTLKRMRHAHLEKPVQSISKTSTTSTSHIFSNLHDMISLPFFDQTMGFLPKFEVMFGRYLDTALSERQLRVNRTEF